MAGGIQFQSNQLLFSISNGSAPTTISTKFRTPKPIIIEKIPIAVTPRRNQAASAVPISTLHFSAVSMDSLSRAVDLAKHDLKSKKLDFVDLSPSRNHRRSTATKIIHSKSYHDKMQHRQRRHSPVLAVKERQSVRPSRTAVVQTEQVVDGAGVGKKYSLAGLPARSMSPPTRDVPVTHEDKVLGEICRLRSEMTKFLQQMRTITQQRDFRPRETEAPRYAEDIEENRKRKVRTEERATRSARTVYMLLQETNKLHEEIKKLDTKSKLDTKKSSLTSRLAALHRSVVRALQLLVQQMADGNRHQSIARDYRNLAIIIRQLSIGCAQLEVTNESSASQNDLLGLLKDVAELNEIVDKEESPSSPPRPCRSLPSASNKTESNSNPVSNTTVYHHPIEKVKAHLVEIGNNVTKVHPSAFADLQNEANKPELRKAALTTGLQKLLKGEVFSRTLVRAPPTTSQKGRQHRKKLRGFSSAVSHSRKGNLITTRNKGFVCQCGHQSSCMEASKSDGYQRYTQPTVSTSQKKIISQPEKSVNQSCDSPARSTCPSASEKDWHFAEPTFSKSQKEVSASRERSLSGSRSASPAVTPRSKNSKKPQTQEAAWQKQLERDVRSKIEPFLESGMISADVNKVADEIVGELMEDMAKELHVKREENMAAYRAAVMHDAPNVDAILKRIEQIEMEEAEIRLRWASLSYGDIKSGTKGITFKETSSSPEPFEINAGVAKQLTGRPEPSHVSFDSHPIIFTKPHSKSNLQQTDFQIFKRLDNRITVSMQPESLHNIIQQVQNYESYLRRHINERVDVFNPWKVVEEIADNILEGCLLDVCLEMEDINNDIVDHIYTTEFALSPDRGK